MDVLDIEDVSVDYRESTDRKIMIRDFIKSLPEMERNCYCLSEVGGWTQEMIATHYGISRRSVSNLLLEACKKIQKI